MSPYLSTQVYRYFLLVAALLLAVPAIFSFTVDREVRSQLESRELSGPPSPIRLVTEPLSYFADLNQFLGDRTAGVVLSTRTLSMTRFYVLGDTPSELIHLGAGRTVFVHTFNPEQPYQAAQICRPRIQQFYLEQLPELIAEFNAHVADRVTDVRLFMIPSKITLYGDRFTRVAPPDVARGCRRTELNNPFVALNDTGPGLIHYPWEAMRAGRDDPDFYPSGSFHWQGESVHAAVASWIAAQPETPLQPLDDAYETIELEQDIPGIIGFERHYPGREYAYRDNGVHRVTEMPVPFPANLQARQAARYFVTDNPVFDRRVLLLTNSFGIAGHPHLAPLYREMVWVNVNGLNAAQMRALIDDWGMEYDPDSIIILLHDVAAWRTTTQLVQALR